MMEDGSAHSPVLLDQRIRFDSIGQCPAEIVADAEKAVVDFARNRSVLNIGCCGSDALFSQSPIHGTITEASSGRCVGIDIFEEGVERLCSLGLDARVEDAQNFDLPEKDFDAVILGDVIEHVGNPGAMLDAAYRHLRPGGEIFVATPNVFSVSNFSSIFLKNGYLVNSEHVVWFDPGLLSALLERSNFRVKQLLWMNYDEVLVKRLIQKLRPSLMGSFAMIAVRP